MHRRWQAMQRCQQSDDIAAVGVVHIADQRRLRALGTVQQILHGLDIAVFTAGAKLPGKGDNQRAVEKTDRPAGKRPLRIGLHELAQFGAFANEAFLVHPPAGEDAIIVACGIEQFVRGQHLKGDILFIVVQWSQYPLSAHHDPLPSGGH